MAKFLKSAASKAGWINDGRVEVCFVGRSNVGKSTLINAITNSKIAKTSNTPGRTQLVNFFEMDKYRLVDLPGYGYAKVSHQKKLALSDMILEYLHERTNLLMVFQVCDANVLTPLDQEMAQFLQTKFQENHYIILNKLDKQSKSFFYNNKHKFIDYLNVPLAQIIPISAAKKTNIDEIYKVIANNISA